MGITFSVILILRRDIYSIVTSGQGGSVGTAGRVRSRERRRPTHDHPQLQTEGRNANQNRLLLGYYPWGKIL